MFYINQCIIKMNNKVKDIDIKNYIYYFFNGMINIKAFDPNNIKLDENWYKNILVYYIGYVTIKGSKCFIVSVLYIVYIILSNMNVYFEEINKSNY